MDKIIVIGATGTLGKSLVRELVKDHIVVAYARREKGHIELTESIDYEYRCNLDCIIGDISDRSRLKYAMEGCDTVFHLAAMKHVDLAQQQPTESIKTNITGTENVLDAMRDSGIGKIIFSSTDKAVLPINTYGQCKAIAENLVMTRARIPIVTRWGNVINSSGSIVEKFMPLIIKNQELPITDLKMTRFWLGIEDARNFILRIYNDPKSKGIYIPQGLKTSTLHTLVTALSIVYGLNKPKFKPIGIRPGERTYELLKRAGEEVEGYKTSEEVSTKDIDYKMNIDEMITLLRDKLKVDGFTKEGSWYQW